VNSITAATCFLLLAACEAEERADGPSLLVVTIDTWRADHLTPLFTPNIHALAEQGLRFENAWTPMGLTSPAHASLFTGQLPWQHGMRGNNHHGYELEQGITTLAERASDAGWRTAAFVSAYPAGPEGGLDQGFQVFDGPEASERSGGVAVRKARAWLHNVPRKQRFLLWVHLFEPHGPYDPPEADIKTTGATSSDRDRYGAEVHAADRLLAPLLEEVWDRGDTLLTITADHGETLDEEVCGNQHERSIHEVVLRVPLVLAGPGLEPALREEWVGLTDVVPTLTQLADLPALPAAEGTSLLEAGPGRPSWAAESGLCEKHCAPGCQPAGLLGRDRVIIGPTWRIIDRPGRGRWAEGDAVPLPATWDRLFMGKPRVQLPPGLLQQEEAEALGYSDPAEGPPVGEESSP